MNSQIAKIEVNPGEIRGLGPLGLETRNIGGAAGLFEDVLSKIIGVLTVVAVIWFVLQIIFGAYSFMSAGGDQKAVGEARSKITNAIIGLFIVFIALVLVSLIAFLLGIESIINIEEIINRIAPVRTN